MFGNIIKYRVNRRGRPREFNIDKAIAELYEAQSNASTVLQQLRETSRGYRSERMLGTSTTAPTWVQESFDLLQGAQYGRDLSVKEIQQIKSDIRDLKRLGSTSRRSAEQGYASLVDRITTEYEESLSQFSKYGRKITKESVQKIKNRLGEMSAREKGEFFFSQHYQDPKAQERYKRVQRWAQASTGTPLTMQESWAYLFNQRMAEGLD